MAADVQTYPGLSLLHFRWVRQLLLFAGLALAIAVGVVVALWTREPNYTLLHADMTEHDRVAVSEALRAAEIPFRIDPGSGALLVPSDQAQEVRLRLAASGLPQSDRRGFEILNEEQGFGTSQFIETARYRHALEQELARSIASLRGVESARVHLALPKQSVFIRTRSEARASVLIKLFPGRVLDKTQVNAIVHMVASSVPNLEAGNVALIDQMGRLLSEPDSDQPLSVSAKQLEYTRTLEDDYSRRIVNLLEPVVGLGKIRAEVNAVLDFTQSESTQESFDPAASTLRSEQISQQQSRGNTPIAGIPGALSNQPPGAGTVNPSAAGAGATAVPSSESRNETRNFEVDRTVSHTRRPVGAIVRLSAAVVIDERVRTNNQGAARVDPYTEAEMARFSELIRQALGFSAERGDSINLVSSSFVKPEIEAIEEPAFWEEPWVWDLAKHILGGAFILALLLYFVKPVLRTLSTPPPLPAPMPQANGMMGGVQGLQLLQQAENSYEQKVDIARSLVKEHPERVANLVKGWVKNDG